MVGGLPSTNEGSHPSVHKPERESGERRALRMTVFELIAFLTFVLEVFSAGFAAGRYFERKNDRQ